MRNGPRETARARYARHVEAQINYIAAMTERAKFHAQDHERDNLRFNPQRMTIENARSLADPPTLEREGIMPTAP